MRLPARVFGPVVQLSRRMSPLRRVVVPVVGLVSGAMLLAGSALQVPAAAAPVPAADAAAPVVADRPDAVSAMLTARAQGSRVENVAARTQSTESFANPDGTWTVEDSGVPVRFQDASGDWRTVDTGLLPAGETGDTKAVGPALTPADITFAGPRPAAPKPVELAGVSAVPDPATAAVDPDPTPADAGDDTSSTPTGRGAVSTSAAGSDAKTAAGVSLAWAGAVPTPTASGDTNTYPGILPGIDLKLRALRSGFEDSWVIRDLASGQAQATLTLPLTLTNSTVTKQDDGSYALVGTDGTRVGTIAAPVVRDARVDAWSDPVAAQQLPMTVTKTPAGVTLTISGYQDYLTDPATVFPVTIDPATTTVAPLFDTTVQEGTTTDSSAGGTLHVGNFANHMSRTYMTWQTVSFSGATVVSAAVSLYQAGAGTCSNKQWQLYGAYGATTATRWTNQPTVGSTAFSISSANKGFSSACAAAYVSIDATAWAADASSRKASSAALMFRATDETDTTANKVFASSENSNPPKLIVTYKLPPGTPSNPVVSPKEQGTGNVYSTTPQFTTAATDPDGDDVTSTVEIYKTSTASGVPAATCRTPSTKSGVAAACTPSTTLTDNTNFWARAQATDATGAVGGWSSLSADPFKVVTAWSGTVALRVSRSEVDAQDQSATVTATASAPIRSPYYLSIYDETNNPMAYCRTVGIANSLSCDDPSHGGNTVTGGVAVQNNETHTYKAYVSQDLPNGAVPSTDVRATSGSATVTNTGWHGTVTLTRSWINMNSQSATVTATASAPIRSPYYLSIYDETNNPMAYCRTVGIANSLSCDDPSHGGNTVTGGVAVQNNETHTYKAYVSQDLPNGAVPSTDVRASSTRVSMGDGPMGLDEVTGGSNPSESCTQRCSGDPVNVVTGEFFESLTDLALPGSGPGVAWGRSYGVSRRSVAGPLGFGWTATYDMNLTIARGASGSGLASASQVQVRQENGSVVVFTRAADGTYRVPSRVRATLVVQPDGSFLFVRNARERFIFSSAGLLTGLADGNGTTVSLGYSSGHLTTVTGRGSRVLTLGWTGDRVTSVADGSGRTVAYGYDGVGNLTAVTDPVGGVTRYGYDGLHRVVSMTTPAGGVTANTYDDLDRVVTQTDPLGKVTRFAYGDGSTTTTTADGSVGVDRYTDGQVGSHTQQTGTSQPQTWSYTYDPAGNLTSTTQPSSAVIRSNYDSQGNRTTQTDPLGQTTSWTFDALNDQLSVTDPLGRASTSTYNAAGNLLSLTDPAGHVQRWTYNADGTVASATSAAGRATTYTYDPAGRVISSTDGDNRTTGVGYDATGRVISRTDAASDATTSTVDAAGRITATTDPNGRVTRYTFDGDGNQLTVTDPAGHVTTSVYDAAGRVVSVTDPAGHKTTSGYDPMGRLTSTTDPNGHTTTLVYDALGNVASSTDPAGSVTSMAYDVDGHRTSTTLPSGAVTRTGYDAAGQVTSTVDANGHTTARAYDQTGQLLTSTDPDGRVTTQDWTATGQVAAVTSPDQSQSAYTYDADGLLTAYTDPDGNRTTHTYDSAGLATAQTAPGGKTTSSSYDAAGRPAVTTAADGTTTTAVYDPAGQLTGLDYSDPATHDVTYVYDAAGQRTSMTDGTGTTRDTYDAAGQLTAATNGAGRTVGYGYDPAGQLSTLTYPGGDTVTYAYDPAGQMSAATDWAGRATRFTWTPDGQPAGQVDPTGDVTTLTHDPAGQTTDIQLARPAAAGSGQSATTLTDQGYTYDPAGDLTDDTTAGGPTHHSTYDRLTQLSTVTTPSGTSSGASVTDSFTATPAGQLSFIAGQALSYDTAQQLTTSTPATGPPTTYVFTATGDRATATTAAASGTPAAVTRYNYDATDTLTAVTAPTGAKVSYTTDGDGHRATRTTTPASSSPTTTSWVWDTTSDIPQLLDDGTHRYLYGPDLTPYAQVDTAGTVQYFHTDLVGSVTSLTDSTGALIATTRYSPYGARTAHTGTADSAIGFTGAWTDSATGLVHLRARDYDPTTGQFLTIDPALDTTHQPYTYAANNPLQNTDPTGLWCLTGSNVDGRCNGSGPINRFLASDANQKYAAGFEHGPSKQVYNLIYGYSDDQFGISSKARELISPGSSCFVDTDSWAYRIGSDAAFFFSPGGIANGFERGALKVGDSVAARSAVGREAGREVNLKGITDKQLKKYLKTFGDDPHSFKAEYVTEKAQAKFDIKLASDGELILVLQRDPSVTVSTGRYVK